MADFYSLIYKLEALGVYDYFLPFLLVFIIIFAILEKTYIFGSVTGKALGDKVPRSNINAVLAMILALMVIVNTDVIYLMNQYLTRITFFIVLAVTFMLLAIVIGWIGNPNSTATDIDNPVIARNKDKNKIIHIE